jgi:hypothetical protein
VADDLVDFDGPFGGLQLPPPHLPFAERAAGGTGLRPFQEGDLLGGEVLANVAEDNLGHLAAGFLDAGEGGLLASDVVGGEIDLPLFCQLGEGGNILGRLDVLKHVAFILELKGATSGEKTSRNDTQST